MNRREELKQMYKEIKTEAGVYRIHNVRDDKSFVESTLNLNTINGKRFSLNMGSFINKSLQADWSKLGEDAFVIEVLEKLEIKPDPFFDAKGALAKLEAKWLDKLQPFGERGYNQQKPL